MSILHSQTEYMKLAKEKIQKTNKQIKNFLPAPPKFQHADFVSTLTFLG